ncbi:hypothetical protein [Flaviaesturariibacter amylovorans]|uniref:TraB/GumN family protein n=1 Tax=Flaviaesturariibacter amylovorans TaxID=1084520 RepID=A0ABP8HGN6_9BACT
MKKFLRIAGYTAGTALLLLALVFFVAWRSPKYYRTSGTHGAYPIVAFKDYSGEHPRPYVIGTPAVTVFGAAHTRDPKDSQLLLIDARWKALRPTVALVEGRLGFLLPGIMDPVRNLGEGGHVKALASADGIPVYNWDLDKETLAQGLSKRFPPAQVALAQVLNPYFGQLRFGKPSDPAAFLAPFFERARYVGMQDSLKTIADIDRLWQRYFSGTDWRNVSDEHALPGYLAEMMAAGNDLRNQQLVAAVKELTAKGERVFVLCGSSHAFCVAPSFSPTTALLPTAARDLADR